jgi:rRNA maturation endonuclease Nob1
MGKISREILYHFQCEQCQKWWSISDAPVDKKSWYCPWCGTLQTFEKINHPPVDKSCKVNLQKKSGLKNVKN